MFRAVFLLGYKHYADANCRQDISVRRFTANKVANSTSGRLVHTDNINLGRSVVVRLGLGSRERVNAYLHIQLVTSHDIKPALLIGVFELRADTNYENSFKGEKSAIAVVW